MIRYPCHTASPLPTQSNVTEALELLSQRDLLLSGLPPGSEAAAAAPELLDTAYTSLKKLQLAVASQQPDKVSIRVAEVLKAVAELELLQAPGLPFVLPKEYQVTGVLAGPAMQGQCCHLLQFRFTIWFCSCHCTSRFWR